MLKALSCIVCDRPMNRLDKDGQAVCSHASCRFVLSKKGKMPDLAYSFFLTSTHAKYVNILKNKGDYKKTCFLRSDKKTEKIRHIGRQYMKKYLMTA